MDEVDQRKDKDCHTTKNKTMHLYATCKRHSSKKRTQMGWK